MLHLRRQAIGEERGGGGITYKNIRGGSAREVPFSGFTDIKGHGFHQLNIGKCQDGKLSFRCQKGPLKIS